MRLTIMPDYPMFDYFRMFYLELEYGIGFVLTEVFFAAGAVLVFERMERTKRSALHILWQIPAVWLISLLLSTLNQMLLGGFGRNIIATGALILLYCLFSRAYALPLRLVRGMVYYACYQQALALSESGGYWLRELLGQSMVHGVLDNATWVLILVILILAVILINCWAVEDISYLPAASLYLILLASGLGVLLQYSASALSIGRIYEMIVAGSFLFLELFSYYLLYIVSRKTKENLELLYIEKKEQLDEELLQSFHDNLENMHMIRHEIRNHMAYIRVLVAQEEYDKLFDYTNAVLGEAEVLFTSVASGNDVVDAVLNHEIQKAGKQGIRVEPSIVAPPQLPFAEKDFCSVLSNLMDNAIEASAAYLESIGSAPQPEQSGQTGEAQGGSAAGSSAAQSGRIRSEDAAGTDEARAVIEVNIRPQQDYLFIRVTNPVSEKGQASVLRAIREKVPVLRTTKDNAAFHGYGTKIVRRIVERYDGSVNFDMQGGRFIADVMLALSGAERKS